MTQTKIYKELRLFKVIFIDFNNFESKTSEKLNENHKYVVKFVGLQKILKAKIQ